MTKEPFWPWDAGYDDIPDEHPDPDVCVDCDHARAFHRHGPCHGHCDCHGFEEPA